ncbi:MAG TPA: alpha/beta hydrolase [Gammaproteobacteria bacterium]|nr:alpha/beta hydrolase [Gammaproteobacteria bacterium]
MRLLLIGFLLISSSALATGECVVLLHGLLRSASSMEEMEQAFIDEGFEVVNVDYPSRDHPVEDLAPLVINKGVGACPDGSTIHFVTHSLGGILVRYYLEHHELSRLGRVVMLAPPNKGSEAVDGLKDFPGYHLLNGPAGMQLGTDENSIPSAMGPVEFEVGIIAGTRTISLILSQFLPNPDDDKVSVERTKVDGVKDFIAVPHSHPFIMQMPIVIK